MKKAIVCSILIIAGASMLSAQSLQKKINKNQRKAHVLKEPCDQIKTADDKKVYDQRCTVGLKRNDKSRTTTFPSNLEAKSTETKKVR